MFACHLHVLSSSYCTIPLPGFSLGRQAPMCLYHNLEVHTIKFCVLSTEGHTLFDWESFRLFFGEMAGKISKEELEELREAFGKVGKCSSCPTSFVYSNHNLACCPYRCPFSFTYLVISTDLSLFSLHRWKRLHHCAKPKIRIYFQMSHLASSLNSID